MSDVVVDQNTPIESIIALAQMGGQFKFRCLSCGSIHYVYGSGWKSCSKNYRYSQHASIPGIVAAVFSMADTEEDNKNRCTTIELPELIIELPKIYPHKLVLHEEKKAAELLLEYVRIYKEFSAIRRPQIVVSDNRFIPLHIIVGWEKIRQFAYDFGVLPKDSPFQNYRRALLKCIEKCAAFVREHIELFTSYMPIPVKVAKEKSSQQISALRADEKAFSFYRLCNICKDMGKGEINDMYALAYLLYRVTFPTIEFLAPHKQPSFMVIKGSEYVAIEDFSYNINFFDPSSPSLKCRFNVQQASSLPADPTEPVNRKDPITNFVLKTIEELQFLFKGSIEGTSIVVCSTGRGYN